MTGNGTSREIGAAPAGGPKHETLRDASAPGRDPVAAIYRQSMLWTPEREAPSAWTEHVPFAFWLVDVLRPATIVELGTHAGMSYSAMCQAVKALNLPAQCFAIDTWKGDEHAGFYGEEVYRDFAAFHDPRYGAFSRLVRSTFDEALPHFEDASIHLLHIDGLHTDEAVRHDFLSWQPKLASNAVVILHDTNVRERGFGVFRLWEEISAGKPHFAFLHGHGLGVLGLGRDYPRPLRFLFDATDNGHVASSIRGVFAHLGRSVAFLGERAELDALRDERARLVNEIARLRDDEIVGLNERLAERDKQISSLESAAAEREREIASVERTIGERGGEITELRHAVAERDRQIVALNQAATGRDKQITSLEHVVAEREREIVSVTRAIGQRDGEITALRHSIVERDEAIAELRQAVVERDEQITNLCNVAVECKEQVAALNEALAGQQAQVASLESRLSALYVSTSWRAAAPLRAARRLIGRLSYSAAGYALAQGWRSLRGRSLSPLREWRAVRVIARSGLFDREWYLKNNPDVVAWGINPIRHYVAFGAREGRDPSPSFSTCGYLSHNADVAAAGLNPLVHFVVYGAAEGRAAGIRPAPHAYSWIPYANDPYREMLSKSARNYKSQEYRSEISDFDFDLSSSKLKLFAYYLPQFHPIPENDLWWGKGFTEWTNVARALPQFEGHDQPRLPSDLGFYDLRNEAVLEQQVALAKKYGIEGFCFHFYWFAGKRLLERPLDTFLGRRDLDLRFCLCWANENWTRRWDGQEKEVLIAQEHSPDDDVHVMTEMCRYICDPRYLTVGGRPVVIVYRVDLLPKPKETAERWRRVVRELLQKDVFLVCAMTFGNTSHPAKFGFDASVQFPPHCIEPKEITSHVTLWNAEFSGSIYDYEDLAPAVGSQLYSFSFPVFPTVFPGWDNTPRRGSSGYVFAGSNPDSYATWLSEAALFASDAPVNGNSIVFINSWNEWAEGAFLEPDQKFGHAFLRATAEVLRPYCHLARAPLELRQRPGTVAGHKTVSKPAIIIHAYYPEILLEFLERIPDVGDQALYISVPEERQQEFDGIMGRYAPNAAVFLVSNRGRDVRPFLALLRYASEKGHSSFVKLHTKKSGHRADGAQWCASLTAPLFLLCQRGALEALLQKYPELGLVAAKGHVLDGKSYSGGAGNMAWLRQLCAAANIAGVPEQFVFAGGNMFAGRIHAINQVLNPEIANLAFEEEQNRRDGTLAHAFERFFGILTQANGFEVAAMEVLDDGDFLVSYNEKCQEGYKFADRAVQTLVGRTLQQQHGSKYPPAEPGV